MKYKNANNTQIRSVQKRSLHITQTVKQILGIDLVGVQEAQLVVLVAEVA